MALNLNETATLTLQLNNGDVSKSIDQLNDKAKELRKTINAIEKEGGKGGENWQKYKNDLKDVQTATSQLKKEVDVTTLTYGQLDNLIKTLNKDLKGMKPNTEEFIAATKRLGEAEKQFKGVKDEVDKIKKGGEDLGQPSLWSKIGGGVGVMAKAFQAFMALQVIGYVIDIGKSIFETTAKFEKYGKVLETALGSQKEAQQAMAALKDLGAKTAFSVDELTEGYVKMINRGLRPSQKEMVAMTDLAASQGKTFDQLVEAALDAQTGEFERLKEFGIKASKSGDQVTLSFKGMNQVVKNTPEAINGAIVAFGQMSGVGGQNAKMMETLEGKTSNLGDSFDSLKVEIGTGLRPIFVALLELFGKTVPVLSVVGKAIGSVLLIVKSYLVGVVDMFTNTGKMLWSIGEAAGQLATGNLEGAKKTWETAKKYGADALTSMKTNLVTGVNQVVAVWKDPNAEVEAKFAGAKTGKAHGDALTAEQKKALDKQAKEAEKARKAELKEHEKALQDTAKANQKALEEMAKVETETHIASIKDEMQREFVKLMAKRDLEAEEILRSVASEEIKNQQIAGLNQRLEAEIAKTAAEFGEKKRKKAEETEKNRLEAHKAILEQERLAENALLDWKELAAKGNATKLADIHKERLQIQYDASVNKLNADEAAEKAKASREIQDKGQLTQAITGIEDRYRNERTLASAKNAADIEKIEKELKEKKNAIWTETSSAFSALLKGDLNGFITHANKIVQGEKEAWQKRLSENMEKYEAVAQMATAAAQFLANLAKTRAENEIKEAQRIRDENVRLLNDRIAAEKAAQDVAEAEKQRVTQESNDKIAAIKSSTEATISSLENQYRQLSSREEKAKVDQQLQGYKESADEKGQAAKDTAEDAVEAATTEAKESIRLAKETEAETIKAAKNERDEKIDAAEIARDAEIAAINKRKDIDQDTRKTLLAEAKDKFEQEKKMATDEAQLKIDKATLEAKTKVELAESTKKLKTELANDQRDAELKAIKAVQDGDTKAAKEILANAKDDQKEKIRLAKEEAKTKIDEAEREKKEKLKKVEEEKQTRIQNQKELNRQIEDEQKRARAIEAEAKRKQWQAQRNADIASAIIAGSLAALKALASGFWPVNLVFAAATAVMTGIQVAMIKRQPEPSFAHGGFIPQGGRHGSTYGTGGLAIIDRETGQERGEMEGNEAIISREQTAANMPLIQRMFANARTPGRRNKPVTDFRGGAFQQGGLFDAGRWPGQIYRLGSRNLRRYADGGIESTDEGGGSGSSYSTSDGEGPLGGAEQANQAQQQAIEQGKQQLKVLAEIRDMIQLSDKNQQESNRLLAFNLDTSMTRLDKNLTTAMTTLDTDLVTAMTRLDKNTSNALAILALSNRVALDNLATTTKSGLDNMANQVAGLKGSINAVEGAVYQVRGAVNGVEGAVYGTNQSGRLDALIGSISAFARK